MASEGLLREIAERDDRAVRANVELLVANARFAAAIAAAMADGR